MQGSGSKKADQATVRQLNMSAILRLLRDRGTLARADLAKELGMTRNTASNVVAELLRAGLVMETEYRREGTGRPGLLLELAPSGGFAVGAEIDIGRVIVVVVDFKGKMLWEESARIGGQQTQAETIATAEHLVREALAWGRGENLNPLGIGLGLAGLVDAERGRLVYAPTLGWRDIPFQSMWAETFGVPVLLDNEANTSALGYHTYTNPSKARNLAYLSIGMGMAAGFMLEGRLFRGSGGFAGQAGHMKIRPEGEPCTCGDRGCWVTEVGLPALIRKTGGTAGDLGTIASRLRGGDAALAKSIDGMADMLGLGIVNLVNLFNLDSVVLGGAMRSILPFMLDRAKATVAARALAQPGAEVAIKVAGREDDAVYGAACLVLDAIMNHPITYVRSFAPSPNNQG